MDKNYIKFVTVRLTFMQLPWFVINLNTKTQKPFSHILFNLEVCVRTLIQIQAINGGKQSTPVE